MSDLDAGPAEIFSRAIKRYGGFVTEVAHRSEVRTYAERLAEARVTSRRPSVVIDRRLRLPDEAGARAELQLEWFDVGDPGDPAGARQRLIDCDVGVGAIDFTLAETGQLVLFSSGEWGRLLSFLSPYFVGVVRRDRMLDSFQSLLAHPSAATRLRESPAITLIAGCSASGDIEHVVSPGMHGPLELHVLIEP